MNYWHVLKVCFVAGLLSANPLLAQKPGLVTDNTSVQYPRNWSIPGSKIKYYKADSNAFTHVPAPDVFLRQRSANGRLAAPKAQFIVTYTNFTAEARRAFQYAVDIWASLITSSVPIRIQANWVSMEPNMLGSAGPASYRYNFDGGQKIQAFYPVALAEKIARRPLNNDNEADIVADFNRNNDWYYGTDGKLLKDQMDLVTVALHELAHGLGFIGFYDFVDDQGVNKEAFPSIYDYFLESEDGRRLVASNDFPNYSDPLKYQLAGERLYLNGPVLKQTTGQRIKVYAPFKFNLTYSLYHLDDTTYPPGSVNSLMRAHLNRSEAIHSPGPLVLNFFSDLEWRTTSVLHTPPIIDEDVKDFVFSTRIISDTTLLTGSPKLVYRKTKPTETDTVATSVALTRVGTTDEYQFTLPAAQAQGEIWYYFQAQDASGRTFSNPGRLKAGAQTWHRVWIGPDKVAPAILFSPSKSAIFLTTEADTLPIYARIADDATGISTAYVDYQINGITQPAVLLKYTWQAIGNALYDSVFVNRIPFPANSLKVGDKITYRIVAQDGSKARNQTVNPSTGFHQLVVVSQPPVREQYTNSFNDATAANDFVGYGFGISTPDHFGDPAIHSEHPYRNGTDFRFQANFDYTLLAPIRVRTNPDSAMIRYDEIVLVEPGAPGSKFGDANFYDYVIIEGSKDNGRTWLPIRDGYNSNDLSDWQTLYQSNLTNGLYREQNSAAVPVPAYFRHRDVPILKPGGAFKAGDQILIRFRLLADQLAYGWGWAIDNLRIQAPAQLVLANEPTAIGQLSISPNPVGNTLLRLEANVVKSVTEAHIRIVGPTGQTYHQTKLKVVGTKINEQIDLQSLAAGLYFVQLTVDGTVVTKKIVIAR
ncbi:T9SS type A sorting domain-containing protein [Spirosoma validum]|uniref:T9SS type A sorting domain-containing protein n=1 Tax=Spirosoma validum TaxID=2771355 RepID=A0A927AYL9_9BACT|nr:T9SS type A sorting domain-containing protein [Spirosoma validum]MBD2752148.1 T9SS type A sorting domain-containing protein [Spirosoma validum]